MSLPDTRNALYRWGAYWRWREQCGWAPVSPSHELIELAKLGCRVQTPHRSSVLSDDIRVPGWVSEIDAAVDRLSPHMRSAVVQFYMRSNVRRARVKSRVLSRAEIALDATLHETESAFSV